MAGWNDETTLDLDDIAEAITTLSAHVSAATCRWLGLVGEFDAREGWADWGCRSCAEWIAWRCAIVPVTARDHVRVARRLRELPFVRGAFARGELSYSKVRAITRIDGVEREQEILDLALCSTAAQLERLVRAYRGVAAVEAGHAAARENRFLAFHHDDDGALVIRGRLPAEEGALVLAALESARDALMRDRREDASEAAAAIGGSASAEAPSGRLPATGATPGRLGASAEAPGDDADAAVEAPPAPPPSHADALIARAEAHVAGGRVPATARTEVVVHVDPATLAGGPGATVGVLDAGEPIPAETVRRLCCDAALVPMAARDGRPLSVGRRTRTVPVALRRALERRDRGCRFPGCDQRRHVDAHHIRHWAHGGETSAANLVLLCRHHHRLVHEEGFALRRERGTLVFRRPDGRRLREVPRSRDGDVDRLLRDHASAGLRIDAETSVPRWWGDSLDLDLGLQAVLAAAPIREPAGV